MVVIRLMVDGIHQNRRPHSLTVNLNILGIHHTIRSIFNHGENIKKGTTFHIGS